MRALLWVLSLAAFGTGCLVLAVARSAVHELIAIGLFVSSSVFFSSAAVVAAIEGIRDLLKEQAEIRLISSVHDMNPRER